MLPKNKNNPSSERARPQVFPQQCSSSKQDCALVGGPLPGSPVRQLASIDIGSNTILLTLVQLTPKNSFRVLIDQGEIPRLSKNLKVGGNFDRQAKARALSVLKRYKKICNDHGVKKILAVGTAAFRKAKDGKKFAEDICEQLKIPVKIISGEEEAKFSYLSAKQDFAKQGLKIGMIDIGGGSTEIVTERRNRLTKISLPIGSVSLTEKFISRHPISDLEWSRLVKAIDSHSRLLRPAGLAMTWVGVAATVTSLLAVLKKMKTYAPKKIHGKSLTLQEIETLTEVLRKLSLVQRKRLPGMHPKRADVLPTGGLILSRLMRYLKFTEITVSNHGLRYGVLWDYLSL